MKQLDLFGRTLYRGCRLVLVCGSRHARRVHVPLIEAELRLLPSTTAIIHGGNGVYDASGELIGGADMLADEVARGLGLDVTAYPADWDRLGRSAGPIRNRQMLDRGPNMVLAFWDGTSAGTFDTLSEARRRGIAVRVVSIDC